ncbi:hypothetical protein L1267_16860 [Pseudoalteromonas sp. OFAV1]|jgi:hypothetical protein|uniref:hypothetical protein n=1 Tax=Pseudoalteromonas sp. OFAV1 TaxID=2908892 RepID=UPI001F3D1F96|nr:hypothetical protein [Pseudoalteromonas sp. OFAV1]MCF2902048.1 hypothetical protein [Pseudoalteromonas sp. OFAV1]
MFEVTPFVPKIIEILPNGERNIFDNYESYKLNRTSFFVDKTPKYQCAHCENKFRTLGEAEESSCYVSWFYYYRSQFPKRYLSDTDDDFNARVAKAKAIHSAHSLRIVSKVTDELGDPIDFNDYWKPRSIRTRYNWWMDGRISPENRGVLEQQRLGNEWMKKFIHTPDHLIYKWYRHPKSTNERRQYDACIVDDSAPRIRAKRGKSKLVTAWDDLSIRHLRSWKQRKVKKQYMVNL